jgi:hypothetical protein
MSQPPQALEGVGLVFVAPTESIKMVEVDNS